MSKSLCVVFVALLIITSAVTGSTQDNRVLGAHLAAIAQLSLDEKGELLVAGRANVSASYEKSVSKRYELDSRVVCQATLERGQALRKAGEGYSGFQCDLETEDLTLSGGRAWLSAVEHTVLDVSRAKHDPLAPKTTEYIRNHRFSFVKEDGEWKLEADQLLDEPASASPALGTPLRAERQTTLSVGRQRPMLPVYAAPLATPLSGPALLQASTLNRGAVVNYAYTYWRYYNGAYRWWGEDCTNFVSQAVRAGGWRDVSGLYWSQDAWWYNWAHQTYTWTSAHYWYWFTRRRPRGYIARYFSDMSPGDVLQADWNRDGYVDHSMVVTRKDGSGTIYLTYHTNNTRDRSITDILRQYPSSYYYGWRLYSSFN